MFPTLIEVGSFRLASYGLMTALGYAAACWYLYRGIKAQGLEKDTFWNLIFFAFLGALVGAKLMYLLVSWPQLGDTVLQKLVYMVSNFRYGFVFYGGAIVGIAAAWLYMLRKKLPFLKTGDFLIVAMPLGHAIGRIGCFLAGCCHGSPTSLPWGVHFPHQEALVDPALHGMALHPTQLYESVALFALFFFLHKASHRPHKPGAIVVLYLIGYALIRFVMEFFRGDFRGEYILGMSPSQWVSVAGFLIGLGVYRFCMRNKKHG